MNTETENSASGSLTRSALKAAGEPGDLIVAIDVGSSRVGCVVAEIENNRPHVLAAEYATSYGIRGGDVVDMKRASEAIRIALAAAAEKAEAEVRTVVVGLSGDTRISTAKANMELNREHRTVTTHDVARLKKFVNPEIGGGRRIIHRFEGPFCVGELQGVEHPEGLCGDRLEMHASFLSVSGDRLDNVLKAVRSAGVEIESVALEPFASSLGVLSEDERGLGAAVLDLGAGAFRGALWEGGRLRQLCVLGRDSVAMGAGQSGRSPSAILAAGLASSNGGFDGIVMALARRFRIAPATAERLLRNHAALGESELAQLPAQVEVAAVDGLGSVRIEMAELSKTLEELLIPVIRSLREGLSGFSAGHTVGVVLTGGGACVRGLPEWVSKRFGGGTVRVGVPRWSVGEAFRMPAELEGARGATLAGLLHWGLQGRTQLRYRRQGSLLARLGDTFRRFAASL